MLKMSTDNHQKRGKRRTVNLHVATLLKKAVPSETVSTILHSSQRPCPPVNCSALPIVPVCTWIHICSLDLHQENTLH